jgi:class 3 adenylate cyclase
MPVEQRIEFRVGVHQGNIVVEDGVNVAAGLRP